MKPWPEVDATSSLRPGTCAKTATMLGIGRQIDEGADRFAIAAAAGQLRAIEREEAAIGREQHQLVGRLGMDPELAAVALAVFDAVVLLAVALEAAQPELVGTDDGDRLLLDGGFERRDFFGHRLEFGEQLGFGDFGAALAERRS